MSDNDVTILTQVVDQLHEKQAPELALGDYFEIFCADQILKDYGLSYDEIIDGITDGEHDGGFDAIYIFVNGEVAQEDFDTSKIKKNVVIDLVIIQSKSANSFNEASINSLISTFEELFDLSNDIDKFDHINEQVRTKAKLFRRIHSDTASLFPDVRVQFCYAAMKANGIIAKNIQKKSDKLVVKAQQMYSGADIEFDFCHAPRLLDLARRQPKTTHKLQVQKSLNSDQGFIVLSRITDYAKLLQDDDGRLRAELFDSNVRDFQGSTEVNEGIAKSLKAGPDIDFWWLNNGVTILTSRASLDGDVLTLENPQIVNGLQTSRSIADALDEISEDDPRNVMVKTISLDEEAEEVRDQIIKATNSQNPVQPATLRATDKMQRDIEEHLLGHGIYYDRRKNHYKNQKKPASSIISIPLMAQGVMALVLGRPNDARARPSSLIKENKTYEQLFSPSNPVAMYAIIAKLLKKVDAELRKNTDLAAKDRSNIRFYVLHLLAMRAANSASLSAGKIAKIELEEIVDEDVANAVTDVWKAFGKTGATDQVAKGADFAERVVELFSPVRRKA